MESSDISDLETMQQVCVVPFRWQHGQLEYCVITSLKKKRWIFPKGIVDPGETQVESGLKEAFEEAGLRGEIQGESWGRFLDSKWNRRIVVSVVPMRVTECVDDFPEATLRERRWVTLERAIALLHRWELRQLLRSVDRRLRDEMWGV